jgi:hypothetical protein
MNWSFEPANARTIVEERRFERREKRAKSTWASAPVVG